MTSWQWMRYATKMVWLYYLAHLYSTVSDKRHHFPLLHEDKIRSVYLVPLDRIGKNLFLPPFAYAQLMSRSVHYILIHIHRDEHAHKIQTQRWHSNKKYDEDKMVNGKRNSNACEKK